MISSGYGIGSCELHRKEHVLVISLMTFRKIRSTAHYFVLIPTNCTVQISANIQRPLNIFRLYNSNEHMQSTE